MSASSNQGAVSAQQRAQHQFNIFQESLPKVNHLALQMLMNEMVPLSMAVQKKLENDKMDNNEETEPNTVDDATKDLNDKLQISHHVVDDPSHKLIQQINDSNENTKEAVYKRLQDIGFQIGAKMSELLIFTNNPNLNFRDMDLLQVMKFVCRDVWRQIYGKQIDNLKTNHRGTFYLFDFDYKPIQSFAIEGSVTDEDDLIKELEKVEPFLEIPVGIIKGVLSSIGYKSSDINCSANFTDRPDDKPKSAFPKGVSFLVQVINQQQS